MATLPSLAISAGEPAGIGFDIILKSLPQLQDCIVIGDKNAITQRAKQLGIDVTITEHSPTEPQQLQVDHIPTREPVQCGQLNPTNATYVLSCLDHALRGTLDGKYDALVTAPLHKGVINDAGIPFTGHTEYLAQQTKSEVVMLLVAGDLRVALATTHLPLAQVAQAITQKLLNSRISILYEELIRKFGIANPHIAVCGLNPHAGEQGHLGCEEIDVIAPAIAEFQRSNMNISGPHPADTLFTHEHLRGVDAVLAMYHDQGLPVLKHAGFGHAVNTTLGLPIIRTSVDHGTALDLAGSGNCDAGSLIAAIQLAREQVARHNEAK